MKNTFKALYEQFFSDPGPFVSSTINILAILMAAGISWWVFNVVIGKLEKKYRVRPFFEKTDSIFILIRRAGHYSILILVGSFLYLITKCYPFSVFAWGDQLDELTAIEKKRSITWNVVIVSLLAIISGHGYGRYADQQQ